MINQRGFTLIELLVVVAIVGILAAIVTTQMSRYKAEALCARVESDVKNAVTTLEAHHTRTESYVGASLVSSQGVSLTTSPSAETIGTITGSHVACLQGSFTYTSTTGLYTWASAS